MTGFTDLRELAPRVQSGRADDPDGALSSRDFAAALLWAAREAEKAAARERLEKREADKRLQAIEARLARLERQGSCGVTCSAACQSECMPTRPDGGMDKSPNESIAESPDKSLSGRVPAGGKRARQGLRVDEGLDGGMEARMAERGDSRMSESMERARPWHPGVKGSAS